MLSPPHTSHFRDTYRVPGFSSSPALDTKAGIRQQRARKAAEHDAMSYVLEFCRVGQERRLRLHWCPQGRWARRLQKSSHGVSEGDAITARSGQSCKQPERGSTKVSVKRCLSAQDKQHNPLHLVSGENFKAKNEVNLVTAVNPARINCVCTTSIISVNLRYNIQGFLVTIGTAALFCPIQHRSATIRSELRRAQERSEMSLEAAGTLRGHPGAGLCLAGGKEMRQPLALVSLALAVPDEAALLEGELWHRKIFQGQGSDGAGIIAGAGFIAVERSTCNVQG